MELILKKGTVQAVVTTKGAELISFKDSGKKEYIWNGNSEYWSGRNPVLFPIVGTLKDGKIEMDGKVCEMGRHGFGRVSEYAVAEQSEEHVVFELKANEETMKMYPRRFVLQVGHKLNEDGFTTWFDVVNEDDQSMPFCIGAHTAFNCPMNEGESFEDYEIVFDQEETAQNHLLTPQGCISGLEDGYRLDHTDRFGLTHEPFAELDTLIYRNLVSTGVKLSHKETGKGVHMDFAGFPFMAFWTMGAKKAPYICIEPWHGCAAWTDETGKFEDKKDVIVLQPGEKKHLEYTVKMV